MVECNFCCGYIWVVLWKSQEAVHGFSTTCWDRRMVRGHPEFEPQKIQNHWGQPIRELRLVPTSNIVWGHVVGNQKNCSTHIVWNIRSERRKLSKDHFHIPKIQQCNCRVQGRTNILKLEVSACHLVLILMHIVLVILGKQNFFLNKDHRSWLFVC